MKKYLWILLFICCSALPACSNDPGRQQIEIAQFEEKQNNKGLLGSDQANPL
jgi:hypothetical protein